jgi:triosephosphate isomerase
VVYGGSINNENIKTLNKLRLIDGFLIGESCCDPDKFLKILEVVSC